MAALKKISLKDIAEKAGVSTALVSFVLNGRGREYRVNEETAQRIQKIAKELNYQPNLAAKSLRTGKSKTIGLVVSDISNPFFSQLARILENGATNNGYTVLFGSSDEQVDKMIRVSENLLNKGVDGLIVVPCENSESYIRKLMADNVPVVLFDRYFPDINISYVAFDNFGATYEATRYLLAAGYRSPAIVAYDVNLIHMTERIRGYRTALEEYGRKRQNNVLLLKQDAPRKSTDRLLQKAIEEGCDAFLFSTNMISIACLYTLKELEHESLERIGLVGFDGNPAFDFFSVPVSYVKQPLDMMVQKALEILIDNIAKKNALQSVLAKGELVHP